MLAGAGAAWLAAAAAHVQVLEQFALAAMIPAAVVAIAGRRVAFALAFPLGFLVFAVPFGEAFVPRLMDWTADFTVAALRLTGIPVYREGTFFAIPSGQWSVVEACSGLRYLIASVTVGTLYAYLNYRRFSKRALFVALSVVVPILANLVRAYMIVMLGHLSGMKLGAGVDHVIYGWIFFGLVIFVLFWVGSFFRDPWPSTRQNLNVSPRDARTSPTGMAGAALGAAALAGAWPAYAAYLERSGDVRAAVFSSPAPASGWAIDATAFTDWRPHYGGTAASIFQTYRKGERSVALYVAYYRNQRQGAELVSSQNVLVESTNPVWANVGAASRTEDFESGAIELRQTRLRSARQRLLVWDWFRISGRDMSNPYFAKALLARDKLLGRSDDSAAIILAAPYEIRPDAAQETLREFARDMLPSIESTLRAVTRKDE